MVTNACLVVKTLNLCPVKQKVENVLWIEKRTTA